MTDLSDRQLRAVCYSMVQAKRIPHIQGTEETAGLLAQRWNVDARKARRAAIMHDCTKHLTRAEQLALCETYQISCSEMERRTVKLLHAKTGAAIAKALYGADDEIALAIESHTTGKPEMSTFAKVLYLADYIEPNRNFPQLETLRKLAYEDLDRAMLLGLEITVAELAEKGSEVHADTRQTILQLKGNEGDAGKASRSGR